MQFERKNVPSNFIMALQKHFFKKGLKVSERKLTDTIFEFLAKNETEVLHIIKKKRNYEVKLKKYATSTALWYQKWRSFLRINQNFAVERVEIILMRICITLLE